MSSNLGGADSGGSNDNSGNMNASNVEPDRDLSMDEEEEPEPVVRPRRRRRLHAAPADSDEEGEDLLADMERDYQSNSELDHFDPEGLSDGEYSDDIGARFAAEAKLDRADRRRERRQQGRKRGRGGMPAALRDTFEEFDDDDEDRPRRRRRQAEMAAGLGNEESLFGNEGEALDIENFDGPLAEYLTQPSTQREIRRRFRNFLSKFKVNDGDDDENEENGGGDDEASFYAERISEMCEANLQTLEVSYLHIGQSEQLLAVWLADKPADLLPLLNSAANAVVQSMYKNYHKIHNLIFVRIDDLPIEDSLRDLRQSHLNQLIKTKGVVTRRTAVFPQLAKIFYTCIKCGEDGNGPFFMTGANSEVKPGACKACQSRGPFVINTEMTVYRNFQRMTIQESPGSVPAGRIPRTKDVILTNDLIDFASPGEEVTVTGNYLNNFDTALNTKSGFPVFATILEANHIKKTSQKTQLASLTDHDRALCKRWAQRNDICQVLVNSIAPSIYGHEDIKRALALTIFGGQEKGGAGSESQNKSKHRIRGDINVLILGDPGMAKSQFLKYAEKTADRAVYATGKGASAVGLTAGVRIDPVSREWTLEGGALVLADRGMCLIDEFDKMNEGDRTSIHEAMEQQSISISKAGIVTSLQARCAVVACANPIGGRYDSSKTFIENVDLTDPILSRFDILCVVRDNCDLVQDRRLADYVVGNHIDAHPSVREAHDEEDAAEREAHEIANVDIDEATCMPQAMLKKYIQYAKATVRPTLNGIDQEKISEFYSSLRQASMTQGGIPVAVRHIESILRMAEAHARMRLSNQVSDHDIDMAIGVMLNSFIKSQKYAVAKRLSQAFSKFIYRSENKFEMLLDSLKQKFRDEFEFERMRHQEQDDQELAEDERIITVHSDDFAKHVGDSYAAALPKFYQSATFKKAGFKFDRKARKINAVVS